MGSFLAKFTYDLLSIFPGFINIPVLVFFNLIQKVFLYYKSLKNTQSKLPYFPSQTIFLIYNLENWIKQHLSVVPHRCILKVNGIMWHKIQHFPTVISLTQKTKENFPTPPLKNVSHFTPSEQASLITPGFCQYHMLISGSG